MPVSTSRVRELLNPTSIAIVGASDGSLWAQGFVKNVKAWNAYTGRLHMVNPRRSEAFGQVCYPSLAAVPEPVDHAAVLVGAERVLAVLEDCAAAGVRSATVIASGFEEAGPEGRRMADEVRAFCDAEGIAIVGPNCYGFNNYRGIYVSRYGINVPPAPGSIGLSFQSGQLGAATADAAYARGIKLAYVVSSGNELVVDWNDYQEFFLEDPDITVMGGVIERIPDPERFASIARRALEAGKPIVLLKPGRSEAATRIAVAHTGSITGSDAITDAFLRDLGIIRVESVEELAETAGLLAKRGWPSGPRTVFIGYSGGAAELFAEQTHGTDLVVEPHDPKTRSLLAEVSTLPETAIHNPFDMTVDGAVHFNEIVRVLSEADGVDIIVSQGQPLRTETAQEEHLAEFRKERERSFTGYGEAGSKFVSFLETSDTQPGASVFAHEPDGGAHYVLGHNGVRALAHAAWYGVQRENLLTQQPGPAHAAAAVELPSGSGPLSEPESKALLEAYGIRVTRDVVVGSAEEAVAAAEQVGYPVVLKVVAPNVAHKSEAGGVRLGITGPDDVRRAHDEIVAGVRAARPDAQIDGVVVTRQITGAKEFLAGISTDENLGPAVVAGLGGIYVEVFEDVALMTPPITRDKAERALRSLRAYPLLAGTRGEAPRDVRAFVDVLQRLGALAEDLRGRLVELDVNPLFVFADGHGAVAGDALVVLR
jgi:acyl-CoA synthetase (NDP forming)